MVDQDGAAMFNVVLQRTSPNGVTEYVSADGIDYWEDDLSPNDLKDLFDEWKSYAQAGEVGYEYTPINRNT